MRFLFNSLICSLFLISFLTYGSDNISSVVENQDENGAVKVIVTGENQPVTVEKGEALILQATDHIILKPGTKVATGGSLHASIVSRDIKSLKKKEQERPLEVTQTEQEKLEEHALLEVAATFISPFVSEESAAYRVKEEEKEQITIQSTSSSGILIEPQRRIAMELEQNITISNSHSYSMFVSAYASPTTNGQAFRVLRL
jgi:hypothetical protein